MNLWEKSINCQKKVSGHERMLPRPREKGSELHNSLPLRELFHRAPYQILSPNSFTHLSTCLCTSSVTENSSNTVYLRTVRNAPSAKHSSFSPERRELTFPRRFLSKHSGCPRALHFLKTPVQASPGPGKTPQAC